MPEPWIQAELDQAAAAVKAVRADGPTAEAEVRCVAPPTGCGQPLPTGRLSTAFRDQQSRDEYDVTHLCQSCQDRIWAPSADEVAAMALDPNYERCDVCGEYRALEFVDVGVGMISGHDCCAGIRFGGEPGPGRCSRKAGCAFGADHYHGCETWDEVNERHAEAERLVREKRDRLLSSLRRGRDPWASPESSGEVS